MTSLPSPSSYAGLAVVGGALHVIGGQDGNSPAGWRKLNSHYAFDFATETWSVRAPMPTARTAGGGGNAAVVGGKIYFIGDNPPGFCTSVVEIYTIATNSWSSGRSMPTPRCHLAVFAVNGLIYAIGGTNTSGSIGYQNVEIYDPATDTWTNGAPMPTGRSSTFAAVDGDEIYVAGGGKPGGFWVNALEVFNTRTNTWSTKAPLPNVRFSGTGAFAGGRFYAIGGHDNGFVNGTVNWLSSVDEYDPVSGVWSSAPALPGPLASSTAVAVNGIIYLVGGYDGRDYVSSVLSFAPAPPPPPPLQRSWVPRAPLPRKTYGLGVAVTGERLYAIGGFGGGCGATASVDVYDPRTNSWSTSQPLAVPRLYVATAVVGGLVYVVGGTEFGTQPTCATPFVTARVDAFNPVTGEWQTRAAMPTPRHLPHVTVVGDVLYVVGGTPAGAPFFPGGTTVEAYDANTNSWSKKASMPGPQVGGVAGTIDGISYVVSGHPGDPATWTTYAYNPAADSWSQRASPPFPAFGATGGVLDGRLHVMGGRDGPPAVHWAYDPTSDSWRSEAPMPTGRRYAGAAILGGNLHVLGGVAPIGMADHDAFVVPAPPPNSPPNSPPTVVAHAQPGIAYEGSSVRLLASAVDEDETTLTYMWEFGDGTPPRAGESVTHTYLDNGRYAATVTVTDANGATAIGPATVEILNVAPIVQPWVAPELLLPGESWTANGEFTDPGADTWVATADYGDGGGTRSLAATNGAFALAHVYENAGIYRVVVTVTDDDEGKGTRASYVTVQSPARAAEYLQTAVSVMTTAGEIPQSAETPLLQTLGGAQESFARGNVTAGVNKLRAFQNQVRALENSRRISGGAATTLFAQADRIIAAAMR